MSVAIIADCHLGGPGGTPEPLLEQLAEMPERGCRRLVLLGDIFHAWVGNRHFETSEVRAVLPALERLRRAGVRIDYIEGNRDFFIADSPYAGVFDSVGTEVAFTVAGVRYLALHGDGLNDRDRQYLFWRWLSKSLPVRLAIRWLPGGLARWLMSTTEGQLSETNFKHKRVIPEAPISAFAERRFAEGHDVMVLGHFHRPKSWRVASGEVRLVDAWFNDHHVEWLAESPVHLPA